MVLTPRPKRKEPKGCSLLLVLPLAGLAYTLSAGGAFNLLEVVYWAAIMAAAVSGLLAVSGGADAAKRERVHVLPFRRGGNVVSWPIVVSAYVAAGLEWGGVPFDPWLWRLVDLGAAVCIVGLRRWQGARLSRSDWSILALFLPASVAYELPTFEGYVATAALVIAQCALAVVDGLGERSRSPAKAQARPE